MPHNPDNYQYPSVTTIIGILRKPALEYYFKTHTPEFIEAEGEKAKQIGTAIHDAIFNHIEKTGLDTETNYPDEVKICVESFLKFKAETPEIKLNRSEILVENDEFKYSGTLDCVGEIDGELVIVDWKTAKGELKIYDEAKYQVSAYVKAYNETNGTDIKKAVIVAIGKDAVGFARLDLTAEEIDKAFEVFKHAAAIYYLQRKTGLKKKKAEAKI